MNNRCNVGSYVTSRMGCSLEATRRVEILDPQRRGGVSHMCSVHARGLDVPLGYRKTVTPLVAR